jgi:hypothetical protein
MPLDLALVAETGRRRVSVSDVVRSTLEAHLGEGAVRAQRPEPVDLDQLISRLGERPPSALSVPV